MARALRGLRGRSAVVALTLLAVLAVNVSAALHDLADDPFCDVVLSEVHTGPAQMERVDAPRRAAEHCVVCHAVQTVRDEQAQVRYTPPSLDTHPIPAAPVVAILSVLASSQPARAPPLA